MLIDLRNKINERQSPRINFREIYLKDYLSNIYNKTDDSLVKERIVALEKCLQYFQQKKIEQEESKKIFKTDNIESCFLGLAIGDALGVPVEFKKREYLKINPVKDYIGYGCWNQLPGTWSDDSSLTFCLTESLLNRCNLLEISKKFIKWYKEGYWGARNEVFDVGNTTRDAIGELIKGTNPLYSGGFDEYSNGNGSLMRIIPLAFYGAEIAKPNSRFVLVKEVSSITHAHLLSVLCCYYYVTIAFLLYSGKNIDEAFIETQNDFSSFVADKDYNPQVLKFFDRILSSTFKNIPEVEINSSGFVIDSLEASIWCLLNTTSFKECVLKAVNLGGDTDTTGCIAGGLAGLYYGMEGIPEKWIKELARVDDITKLSRDFVNRIVLSDTHIL